MSRRPRSIVVPVVMLVIAAALIATTVMFTVMFNGPPPGPGPVPIARVADALRTGTAPYTGRYQRIAVSRSTTDKFGRAGEQPSSERDAAIAALIPVAPDKVHGLYEVPPRDPDGDLRGSFTVAIETGDGWLIASSRPRPLLTPWHLARLLAMLATLAVLSLVAWAVARRISRPIRKLADAAKRARLGAPEAIPIGGPREVYELGRAIEAMQTRIHEQVDGRTRMLAAIAHDLGTPLSRIAFWIEQLPETARERAVADIDEMRAMLSATLRFVRDERAPGAHTRLDLGSLVESLADDLAAADAPVKVSAGPRAVVRGDPQALRRLFANLVENAIRYGERAELSWTLGNGWAEVLVEDAGPGFDPDRAEALFAPFVRGEESRNRATGGTGLGLAIVRSIAEGHGGTVTLRNRAHGGGCVGVRLPVE